MKADDLELATGLMRALKPHRAARYAVRVTLETVEPMIASGYLRHNEQLDEEILTLRRLRKLLRWPHLMMTKNDALAVYWACDSFLRQLERSQAAHHAEVLGS